MITQYSISILFFPAVFFCASVLKLPWILSWIGEMMLGLQNWEDPVFTWPGVTGVLYLLRYSECFSAFGDTFSHFSVLAQFKYPYLGEEPVIFVPILFFLFLPTYYFSCLEAFIFPLVFFKNIYNLTPCEEEKGKGYTIGHWN